MSQLVATAHTSADSIPLGRRIAEIMHEKGQAYSITTMAKRLGFNRETFRLMLKGDREIYSYELDRIAQDLKVPVERILQNDVLNESRELKGILVNFSDKVLAVELANKLLSSAIGLTERCISLNHVGSSLYLLREYDEAHRVWSQALPEAQLILNKYGESRLLLKITANLMLSFTIRKEFSNLYQIVSQAEPFFEDDPALSGVICYSIAKIKEQQSDQLAAREQLLKSLDYYLMTNNRVWIAKAKHNIAAFEYRNRNYDHAKNYFELAVADFQDTQDFFGRILCYKEYVKVLLKQKEYRDAETFIAIALQEIRSVKTEDFYDLVAQLNVLLSIAKNAPIYAEQVLLQTSVSMNVRIISGKFLIDYYNQIGDFLSVAKYHKVVSELCGDQGDILHEEEL